MHTGLRKEDRNKQCVIYLIWCNASGRGYVGQTRRLLWRRWAAHKRLALANKHGMCHALYAAIRKYGLDCFSVYVLQRFDSAAPLADAERWWVTALGTQAHDDMGGYNLTSGGEVGKIYSPETCARISAANKGFVHSDETRAKMSRSHMGIKRGIMSAEQRAKISAANKGRVRTDETRAKMAVSHTGNPLSEAHKEKMRLSQLGRKHSASTIEKIRTNSSGRRHTPESRAKMSASHTGKKRGPYNLKKKVNS